MTTVPTSPWSGRPHAELAELARELLMAGHLIDRAGMPLLIGRWGAEVMTAVAIDEWMSASPVYTKRMQRLLGFEGDTVETIFKGMQLDVGAPPEFLDFRYTVHDDRHGEFHLDHCGALMDVEPMGEELVHAMCHTIEDPTFDATATASNPRAQVRPIHRPPRSPADRHPHCAWTVTIDEDADPLPVPPQTAAVADSAPGRLPLAVAPADLPDDDGWNDYAAPLDPDLVLERFSSATLARILDEVALQGHLLVRGFLLRVVDQGGAEAALDMAAHQLAGVGGVAAKRLAAALGTGDDLDGVAAVLTVHPALAPRSFVDLRLDRRPDELVVSIGPCPALAEDDGLGWLPVVVGRDDLGLRSIVRCAAPHARTGRIDPLGDAVASWRITHDPDRDPDPEADDVVLTEFSTGAAFRFQRRG